MTTKIDNYSFLEKELEFAKLEIANLHDDIHEWMDKCDALCAIVTIGFYSLFSLLGITMIRELAKQYGVENLRFTLKETPLRTCGFFSYLTSSDEEIEGEFEVSEERYRVADNYKIGFKPAIVDSYVLAPRAYYIMDLEAMIRDGYASVRVVNMDQVA